MPVGYAPINLTASATVNSQVHANALCTINAAAGLTVTLPAASGTGNKYEFLIGTTVTSNSVIIQVASASDIMSGQCIQAADVGNTVASYETAADSDTITFDGSTKGGIKGDRVVLIDSASGVWTVSMVVSATGTEATPFSAAVS